MNDLIECNICKKFFSKYGIKTHIRFKHEKKPNIGGFKIGNIPWNKGRTLGTYKEIYGESRTNEIIEKALKTKKRNNSLNHTKETKEKLSLIRSQIIEEKGAGGFLDVKYYSIKNIVNETFKVRGTWEVKFAEWLNKQNILWKRKIYITYKDDMGIRRTYTPDFYIPYTGLYIEIKGYYPKNDRIKLKKVIEQNKIDLVVLFERHIKKLDGFSFEKLKILSMS